MVSPSLAAMLAASDRSWADWTYDVSKSVASAAVVALLIAVIGKGVGWGFLVRVRWSVIAVAFAGPAASIAFSAATEGYSTLRVIVAAVVLGLGVGVSLFAIFWLVRKVWVGRRSWLAPPTPIESYWDAY